MTHDLSPRGDNMSDIQGKFVWHEFVSQDVEGAKAFYGEVFGWDIVTQDVGEHPYNFIMVDGKMQGGIVPKRDAAGPNMWLPYIAVDDVDATLAAAIEAGGEQISPPMDMPNVGRMSVVHDRDGIAICLFDAASESDRPERKIEGAFHWNELWASDASAAVDFYEQVFGYERSSQDMNGNPYHMLSASEVGLAGAMSAPEGAPKKWLPYVTSEDCDAAVARAERHGGKQVVPAMEVEGIGRFTVVADPFGVGVGIITPS
ncbi:unnamed protein product [Laminaria digitata]